MPTQRIAVRIPRNQTDPDAQAFITAAGITDTTQKSAINTLVVNLKAYGIWTKMKALYPMVGGTSTTHKFNLKDPRDLDVAFRLQFNGGLTHSANGILSNGINGFADTFFQPATNLLNNSSHISFYSRTNQADNNWDCGVADDANSYLAMNIRTAAGVFRPFAQDISVDTYTNPDSLGLYIANRTASNVKNGWKNGTKVVTSTAVSGNRTNNKVFLLAVNYLGGGAFVSTRQCAFASIGDGLTDVEAANFYTAVQAFQVALGREIIPNQTLNLDAGKISSYPGTGTIWTDLSNNSRTGTLTNGVGYSTLNNGSLTFNGSNQYVSVTNLGPVLNNVNKFTLNTWFKLNNPSLNNTIFSFGNNGYYNDDILLAVYGSTIFAQVNTGGDGSAYLVAPFTSTTWTNCQIVFDGTQTGNANRLKMYINGVLQTLTYSYTIPATTSNLNFTSAGIGAYSTGGFVNFMNGNVSLTELYNTALNQSEVTQNFNNIKSRYGL